LPPDTTYNEIITEMANSGWKINKSYLSRLLKRWGWSRKIKLRKQVNKFKVQNLAYYITFLVEVKKIPWSKLKFLDESSFCSCELQRKFGISPTGTPAVKADSDAMYTADGETFTVFLMTSLTDDGPIAFHMREGTNDQWDFTEFIISLVDSGKVVSGDYLIMDNCSIHAAEETGAIIFFIVGCCWCAFNFPALIFTRAQSL